MAFPLDHCEVSIFSSFSEKGQTLNQAHRDDSKPKTLGPIITWTAVLRAEFKRLKIHFTVALPPKNHCIIAELAKYTLAG